MDAFESSFTGNVLVFESHYVFNRVKSQFLNINTGYHLIIEKISIQFPNTVNDRIPDIQIPDTFENQTYLCTVFKWAPSCYLFLVRFFNSRLDRFTLHIKGNVSFLSGLG